MNHTINRLSFRSKNIVLTLGYKGKYKARRDFIFGKLHPKKARLRGYGWKSYCEIAKWLGFPEPVNIKIKRDQCPHCGKSLI